MDFLSTMKVDVFLVEWFSLLVNFLRERTSTSMSFRSLGGFGVELELLL